MFCHVKKYWFIYKKPAFFEFSGPVTFCLDQGFVEGFVEGIKEVRETHLEFLDGNLLHFLFPSQIILQIHDLNTTLVSSDTARRFSGGGCRVLKSLGYLTSSASISKLIDISGH